MASPNEIKFLSQKIKGCSKGSMGAPPLLPLLNHGTRGRHDSNNKQQRTTSSSSDGDNAGDIATITVQGGQEPFSWGLRIDVSLIPRLPMYYILDPKYTTTIQDIPVSLVETRISEYLRIQSISFSFYEDNVRLDCETEGMLKFTVQFWQLSGNDGVDKCTAVELQRRQGSVIEMQKIRRELFNFLMTGKRPEMTDRQGQWEPPSVVMVDAETHYDSETGRKEALEICLRMLESTVIDEYKLGLESLMMMTNPSVVSREDAVITAQDLVFQTTDLGRRIRNSLSACFRIAPTCQPSFLGGNRVACAQDVYFEQFHSLGLKILVQALQLAVEGRAEGLEACKLDTSSDFWALVLKDLFRNVERAVQRPHEACMSAKCMRLLSTLKGQVDDNSLRVHHSGCTTSSRPSAFGDCLKQAHSYGKKCHLSLEMESQKLLAMDVDHVLLSH